ncbi:MAG: hypothetical protein M3Q07_16725, partial [Pseudobdellovibrionaceae bacterium]|nr:hypothetical protein [Pseudobdellovibrionaceae bacterium]
AIIKGRYEHAIYSPRVDCYGLSAASAAIQFQDKLHPDPAFGNFGFDDLFQFSFVRNERAGSTYTMHHSVCHTVLTEKNTVSLVIRGAAEKERSLIFDQNTELLWWRFGRHAEHQSRTQQKIMTDRKVEQVIESLQGLGVVE